MRKIAKFRLFYREEDGVAAIEFAFVVPFLLMLTFGAFTLFETARAGNKVYIATQTIADLSTRINEMEFDRVAVMRRAGIAILGHYGEGDNVHFSITSINNRLGDNRDRLRVVWSIGSSRKIRIRNTDIKNLDLPEIPDGESVIVVKSLVEVAKPLNMSNKILGPLAQPSQTFSEVVVRRPRFVSEVCYVRRDGRKLCGNPQGSDDS